jgi:hypothetical protein
MAQWQPVVHDVVSAVYFILTLNEYTKARFLKQSVFFNP